MTETANIHGTDGDSLTVGLPRFDLDDTRRNLIAFRVKYGSDTPIGHRCSNIVEQMQNLWEVEGDAWRALRAGIEKQMADLAKLTQAVA